MAGCWTGWLAFAWAVNGLLLLLYCFSALYIQREQQTQKLEATQFAFLS